MKKQIVGIIALALLVGATGCKSVTVVSSGAGDKSPRT
jgi:hypothetical protein